MMLIQKKLIQGLLMGSLLSICSLVTAVGNDGVSLSNIANNPAYGLNYVRGRSATHSIIQDFRDASLITPQPFGDLFFLPYNTYGQPGVAIFDYDRDGDLDIYVTNGPGVSNNLFSNQLVESGVMTYVDVGAFSGAGAVAQDGMGVCYGDIDNDGYDDLYVLGRDEPNKLFHNNGNGTFSEVAGSGLEGGSLGSASCAMGDINNDGLLDVTVANSYNHGNFIACNLEPFAFNQHNQLFLNQGGNTFTDISVSSGFTNNVIPGQAIGLPTITWAISMVDIDMDGDTDIVFGDDDCTAPGQEPGGIQRGFIHVMLNDGNGAFSDNPITIEPYASGSWMGLDFGDFNCDGHLDIFGSNFGDYGNDLLGSTYFPDLLGARSTRWFLGNGDGTFTDPAAGSHVSVFGWGNGVFDYDNDGDQDLIYHGGIDFNFLIFGDNPGVVLENDACEADFQVDEEVIDRATLPIDHVRRLVQGLALGDLDRNGFVDVVTVASLTTPEPIFLVPGTIEYGSPLDATDFIAPILDVDFILGTVVWNGVDPSNGNLAVEMNSGDNGNKWVEISVLGSKGMTTQGVVNRDGVGAVLSFTPKNSPTVLKPVTAGASFASQHSMEANFGLGSKNKGQLDILWPGGVKNRLYGVKKFERIVFPEIPCSIDPDVWDTDNNGLSQSEHSLYRQCVEGALKELLGAQVLTHLEAIRFRNSALAAIFDPE